MQDIHTECLSFMDVPGLSHYLMDILLGGEQLGCEFRIAIDELPQQGKEVRSHSWA
jgi:hypothetical protein